MPQGRWEGFSQESIKGRLETVPNQFQFRQFLLCHHDNFRYSSMSKFFHYKTLYILTL